MMSKNIYQLLNEVGTDFREYEQVELSSAEKERHKQRILMEVRRMGYKKENKRNRIWKAAAGMAAACAVAVGVMSLANPVLAKEIIGSVFGKLVENAQGGKYEEEYTERYTRIGESAVTIQDEIDKQQKRDKYVTTMENNGVTVSVSDVYCDGYVLYYTATIKTNDEKLNRADGFAVEREDGSEAKISVDGAELANWSSGGSFIKSKDGIFVAMYQLDLMKPTVDLKLEEKDTLVVDWKFDQLKGHFWDKWNEAGSYIDSAQAVGDWHLRFPVTIDRTANKTFNINKEENGITVKRAVKTKAGLVVEVEISDSAKTIYNDSSVGIKDSEGKYLQWMNQRTDTNENGTLTLQLMVLYDGEKDLSFEVTAMDEERAPLINIAFQIL